MAHAEVNNSPVRWRERLRPSAMLANARRSLNGAGTYRPERHYMRGPGPKCREKHSVTRREPMRQTPERATMTSQAQATELLRGWQAAERGLPFDPAQSSLWCDGYWLRRSACTSHRQKSCG
jgi:hypothetical protein